ncbi:MULTISPECIES: GntR family transcriptional regulator [Micromonospora]|uniref:GntR family transcriptional regulator n=1 Tax=Micromonospora TaxID=1873 RepID=UPI0001BF476C|nr:MULTISPECIES: GntR family transcriptional regulator [Micromonospora]ADL48856.1 regulatory protein GntR HTH [Micromonospora aurantiaca ATCC 27029]MCO1618946.1 GntR family transcriptional regulator [Micromonospora sp. CPM1]MDO3683476.1 GntR family transcriptional regulator [Micromonospora sp. C28ISP2-4]OHX05772.1 transcriptional regulator [Micromonospora sp. WMMB235]
MAKWERIAAEWREKIHSGEVTPGTKLPNEQQMKADYEVSLPVVRQALDTLEAEGLVDRRHGRGTFVRAPRQRVRRSPERYQWEKDRARLPESQRRRTGATERDTGLTMQDLDFSAEYRTVPASAELARIFGVPVGAKMLERVYRTSSRKERVPLSLNTSYMVYDVVAENPALLDDNNEPWPGGTQNQLFTIGIELDRIVDEITARPPSADEAEALKLPPGVSVLVLRKVSVDTKDCVVEVSNVVLPGDRTEFVYTTKLARWSE